MSESANWTRRSVLKWLGWLGAAGTVSAWGITASGFRSIAPGQPRIDPRDFFRRPRSAAALGREYLRQVPEEMNVQRLHDLIWTGCTQPELYIARRGRHGLRQVLSAKQRADFECGRVVSINGWVLSLTEARLYGIAALRS